MKTEGAYFEDIKKMSDENFLEEIVKMDKAFRAYVFDLLERGGSPKYLFNSVAKDLAAAKNIAIVCGKVFVQDVFAKRLLRILNDNQGKLNLFND